MLISDIKLIVSAEDTIQLGVDFYKENRIINRANWLKTKRDGGQDYKPIITEGEFEADFFTASVYQSSIAHKLQINNQYYYILPDAKNEVVTVSYSLPDTTGVKEVLLLIGAITGGTAILKKIFK